MQTCTELPEKFKKYIQISPQGNRTLSVILKTGAILIAIFLLAAGCFLFPVTALTQMEDTAFHLLILMLGLLSYSVLHELIRGFLMRFFSGVKPLIRFQGSYAYAGNPAYFCRWQENVISVSPLILITALLVFAMFKAPDASWKWMFYIMQIVNIANSVNDLYAVFRISSIKEDLLVQNLGPSFAVYTLNGQ